VTDSEPLLALTGVAVCSGAAVQSASGFGFALLAAPALFAAMSAEAAAASVLVLSVALNVLMLLGERGGRDVAWGPVGRMLVAALPGLAAGALLIRAVPKPALQVAIGVAVVVAAGIQAIGAVRAAPLRAGRASEPYAVGLLAGTLTTSTTINGPPLVLWLHARLTSAGADTGRAGPSRVRDSLAASFLALNLMGVAALVLLGGGDPDGGALLLGVLLIATVVGHRLGRHVFERLSEDRFRAVGVTVAAVAGAASILAGVLA
jgi:uncharacterized protein